MSKKSFYLRLAMKITLLKFSRGTIGDRYGRFWTLLGFVWCFNRVAAAQRKGFNIASGILVIAWNACFFDVSVFWWT